MAPQSSSRPRLGRVNLGVHGEAARTRRRYGVWAVLPLGGLWRNWNGVSSQEEPEREEPAMPHARGLRSIYNGPPAPSLITSTVITRPDITRGAWQWQAPPRI